MRCLLKDEEITQIECLDVSSTEKNREKYKDCIIGKANKRLLAAERFSPVKMNGEALY